MRGLLLGAGVAVACLVAPAWAATSEVSVGNFSFTPSTIHIQPGGAVSWRFAGPDTNHSVTSDSGQTESFDSDPGNDSPVHAPGTTFSHTFPSVGRFTYHCKVHSFMTGTVVVGTPPGGAGDDTPRGDTTAPKLSAVKVKGGRTCGAHAGRKCRKRPTRVSFALSEAGRVRLSFKRKGGHSPKPLTRAAKAGVNRIKLSTKRVKVGRYKLTIAATDAAGNRSARKTRKFRVRRG
jgi:plastocyanin